MTGLARLQISIVLLLHEGYYNRCSFGSLSLPPERSCRPARDVDDAYSPFKWKLLIEVIVLS